MEARTNLNLSKRIVVKVGSSSLTYETGKLNLEFIEALVRELAELSKQGKEIVLVTSGAVSAGASRLGLKRKPRTIPEKQAAAAVGQGLLMHLYEKLFSECDRIVAQVLLTRDDSLDRERYANSRNTLLSLLEMGVLPIVNENDAVAVEELKLKYGDNDTLGAMVASLIDADLLIILSDVEGLYTDDPKTNPAAAIIREVDQISQSVEELAGEAGSAMGTGGMKTKIQAAKICSSSGLPMVIAPSGEKGVIRRVLSGESIGTLFIPRETKLHLRKRWLAFGSMVSGSVWVDSGCESSLVRSGASLLAAGITRVEGEFAQGSTIRVLSESGRELARGRSNYSSFDISLIMGKRTEEIGKILGSKPSGEVIHRDNLASLA